MTENLLTVKDLCNILGIGYTTAYKLLKSKEIPSCKIGEIVMDKLKDLEAVAYVRFASVYREFKDVNTFMDELKKILQ